jgi:hypothetical protein
MEAGTLTDPPDLAAPLPPVVHFRSTAPPMTKWDMTRTIADVLGLPTDHVMPLSEKPTLSPGQTERPWNTELSVVATEALGVSCTEAIGFEDWWRAYLAEGQ